MLELLTALLGSTLNLPAERIAEILFKKADDGTLTEEINDNALATLTEMHAEHVKLLKGAGDGKTQFDNGYKAGQKEALTALEKTIRKEFSTDSQAQGVDLIRHVVQQAAQKGGKQMDADAVKGHELYVTLERQAAEQAQALRDEYEARIAELQTGYERKERFGKVQEKIVEFFDGLKPVLPSNPSAAANVRREFLSRFADFDYELTEDGQVIVKKDGKRVENRHGHAVSLADLVKQEAELRFDFAKADPRGSAGNNGNPPAGGESGSGDWKAPKDRNEYLARLYDNKTTHEERLKLHDWSASQGKEGE